MIANWTRLLEQVRADPQAQGFELPAVPLIDGRWHACRGGHYFLSSLPLLAMYCVADGEPTVWRHDDRLLSPTQQCVAAQATAMCPTARDLSLGKETNAAASPGRVPRRPLESAVSYVTNTKRDTPLAEVSQPTAVPGSALAQAQSLLVRLLARRSRPTLEIQRRARNAGLSWITVRRAASALGVVAVRKGFGATGNWNWALPKVLKDRQASAAVKGNTQ